MHSSIRWNLLDWHNSFVGKKWKKAWRTTLCLWWSIWKERNRAFNDVKQSDQAIKFVFIYTFVNWAKVYIEDHTFSMLDFVN